MSPTCAAAVAACPPSAAPSWPLARWALAALLAAALCAALLLGLPDASPSARWSLGVFGGAIIAWTVLDWDETPVALLAGLALIATGAASLDDFYAGMGDDFIWLMIAAFMLAAVMQRSGLAQRWTLALVARAGTPAALMRRLTWVVMATAFVVPSTSGRAALLLPVFLVLARALPDPAVVRAMALLFPSVILLSACVSLLGAGAHLVALEFMQRLGGPAPGFGGWLLLAGPFGVASSVLACELILRLFLTPAQRGLALQLPAPDQAPLTRTQWAVAGITALTLLAWATAGWHGLAPTVVALVGALAATVPRLTGVDMKSALKQVEWNLILFMAATLVMGEALLRSGAATALADRLLASLPVQGWPAWGVLGVAAGVALASHLLITSRTARAAVLVPTVALPLASLGVDASLLIFVVVLGSGFCQTFTVSAKPVALFAEVETARFRDADLLRLSLALWLPLWALLTLFAAVAWPAMGLR